MIDPAVHEPMTAAELGVLVTIVMIAEMRMAAGLDKDGAASVARAMFHLRQLSSRLGLRFTVRERRRLIATAGRMIDDTPPALMEPDIV